MDYRAITVDGNWLARSMYEVGICAKGFISKLCMLKTEFRPAVIYVAWDARPSTYVGRKAMFSSYKGQRAPAPNTFWDEVRGLREILSSFNVAQVTGPGEGDDIIATIVRELPGPHLIFSIDKDMFQLVSEEVHLFRNGEVLTPEDVTNTTNINPQHWRAYQAIMGDSADNVPGVSGLGSVKAKQILEVAPYAVEAVLDGRGQKLAEHLAENEKIAKMILKMDNEKFKLMVSYSLVGLYNIELQFAPPAYDAKRALSWLGKRRLTNDLYKAVERMGERV